MRYVDITKAGDPEVLQVRERPLPEIADGEVLIKVAGAGLKGADMTQRRENTLCRPAHRIFQDLRPPAQLWR